VRAPSTQRPGTGRLARQNGGFAALVRVPLFAWGISALIVHGIHGKPYHPEMDAKGTPGEPRNVDADESRERTGVSMYGFCDPGIRNLQ